MTIYEDIGRFSCYKNHRRKVLFKSFQTVYGFVVVFALKRAIFKEQSIPETFCGTEYVAHDSIETEPQRPRHAGIGLRELL